MYTNDPSEKTARVERSVRSCPYKAPRFPSTPAPGRDSRAWPRAIEQKMMPFSISVSLKVVFTETESITACDPEPIADFVDIFFIGEGEKVDLEVIELFRKCRAEGKSKQEFLELSSKIEGVYVPALYDVTYNEDGTIKSFTPKGDAPAKIHKRIMLDMDKSFYPDNFVVPLVEIVHDRAVQGNFPWLYKRLPFLSGGHDLPSRP